MSCACDTGGTSLRLDPWKRVAYARGMVLGVDEFEQAELHQLEAARRANRALHGYGVVCGLDVSVPETAGSREIRVEPGLAIDPQGRWVRVPDARCADLNAWLRDNRALFAAEGAALPSPPVARLVVRLCYRDCLTDLAPIPGGPCRTPDQAMAATRIAESFSLDIGLDTPDQSEVEAVRAFAALLRGLDVVGDWAGDTATAAEIEAAVLALIPDDGAPETEPGPPPALRVAESEVATLLGVAFAAWVDRVRPALLREGRGGCGEAPEEGCLLLAAIDVTLADGALGLEATDVAEPDTALRPRLLHTQLLQEMLLAGAPTGTGTRRHADLEGLEADDHLQYLAVAPRGGDESADALLRNLSGGGSARIIGLPQATAAGQAMPHGQAAGGDLAGSYPAPRVTGLHGRAVPAPLDGDAGRMLAVSADARSLEWRAPPTPDPAPSPDAFAEAGLTRLMALSWRHNAFNALRFDLDGQTVAGVAVAFGREAAGDAGVLVDTARRGFGDGGSLDINSFQLMLELPEPRQPAVLTHLVRVRPDEVVPIMPDGFVDTALFRAGRRTDDRIAPAALLLFPPRLLELFEIAERFEVHLDGDHVLDDGDPPRAVDAEFLRAALPGGDRPEAGRLGVQGGRFRSWGRLRRRDDDIDEDGDGPVDEDPRPRPRPVTPVNPGSPVTPRPPAGPVASTTVVAPELNRLGVDALVNDVGLRRPVAEALVAGRDARGGRLTTEAEIAGIDGVGAASIERLRAAGLLREG